MTDAELLALKYCGPQTVADIREACRAYREGRDVELTYTSDREGPPMYRTYTIKK